MEAGLHPKQLDGAKSVSDGIKMVPKGYSKRAKQSPNLINTTQNGTKRPATATKLEPKVSQWSF